MTFKNLKWTKPLTMGLSMIETNPLNHKWLDFAIQLGLTLHQFQKKLLLGTFLWRPKSSLKPSLTVPSKSQNPIVLGTSMWSIQYPNFKPQLGMQLAPFIWHQQLPSTLTQYQVFILTLYFLIFSKISLEKTNI